MGEISLTHQARARRLRDQLSGEKVGKGRAHLTLNDAEKITAMALRILINGELS